MAKNLPVTGHYAWGMMYSDLSSELKASVNLLSSKAEMGIEFSEAIRDDKDANLLRSS